MKRLFVITLTVAVAYGLTPEQLDAIKKQMMEMAQDCQGAVGASAADMQDLMAKKSPSTKEGKCFLFCMHKKIKFQDESGKIDLPGVDSWIGQLNSMDTVFGANMRKIADNCIPQINDSGDPCDTALTTYECYTREAKQLGVQMIM